MQQVFESWDLAPRPMRPRSRLYAPAPEGIGTAFVESLSGYVIRLAEAHAVSTADLVHRELSRRTSPPLVFYSHGINGLGERATRWVETLESITCRSDLRYLTLLPLKELLPNRLLLRTRRAWCPECYQGMAVRGTVYEPLLWYLKPVEACPRHCRILATTCSHCYRSLRPLYATSRTGRCFHCGIELGCPAARTTDETSDRIPTEYQLWVADAMGQLLAQAPQARPETLADRVRGVLEAYTDQFAEGTRAIVAKTVQCSCNAFSDWFYGNWRPRTDNLLRAWYQLKLPVFVIFSPHGPAPLLGEESQTKVKIERAREVSPRRRRERILKGLLAALDEQPPPSLPEVARRLGYATTDRLRAADRARCTQIVINHRRWRRSQGWSISGTKPICKPSQVRGVLEDHLGAEGRISPLHQIAASLGYSDDGQLRSKFPELCRALSAKIARQRAERVAVIKPIFERALQENPPPAVSEVCHRTGLSASHVRKAYAGALCERLKARRREYVEACRAELVNKLKAALDETPPLPPKEVYVRLGITQSIATYNFPELRRAIIVRYRQYRHQQSRARQEAVRQEIRAIVRSLHEQGVYPSIGRVKNLVKNKSLLKWRAFTEAVNDAHQAVESN